MQSISVRSERRQQERREAGGEEAEERRQRGVNLDGDARCSRHSGTSVLSRVSG